MIKKNSTLTELAKAAARIKIDKKLDTLKSGFENAPFFLEKMERARKILAIAGLPKLK